jgi:glycosyltransferase involved in cell wall biosynthesis
MWPFCGLEHLQPDATKYADPPGRGIACWPPHFDFGEYFRHRKRVVYRSIRELRIVCPSRWLASEAKRSALLGDQNIELIPTSCDTALFSPKPQRACREVLRLPVDKTIVLVGATSIGTRWKGIDLFIAAMKEVVQASGDSGGIHVVTFGMDTSGAADLNGIVSFEHLGPVQDRRLMSAVYNAVDVFVAPSRMENLANTVLEALSCGTPVAAFAIGGMPDMIDHKVNGFLALPFYASSLAEGIRWAIDGRGDQKIRQAARNKIICEFSPERESDCYIDLYRKLLTARI